MRLPSRTVIDGAPPQPHLQGKRLDFGRTSHRLPSNPRADLLHPCLITTVEHHWMKFESTGQRFSRTQLRSAFLRLSIVQRSWGKKSALIFLVFVSTFLAAAAAQENSSTQVVVPSQTEKPQNAPPAATEVPASPQLPSTTSPQQPSTESPRPSSPQSEPEGGGFVFRKQVQEVVLRAVVVDGQNNLLSSLNRDAFNIFEDGKPQTMTSFRRENVPLALGILIDNSGSMRPKRDKVNDAALNLVRSSNPRDEVFVVNFGDDYYLDQDFTDDVDKLKAALQRVETRGSTALYDAIVASAAHIRQDTKVQKRVLLVVTDGQDNASQDTLEEVVQQLQQPDSPVVYVIALLDESRNSSSAVRALQSISRNTGGTAYFPKDPNELDSISRSIARDIRSQYVIGYKSSNPSGSHVYHSIDVQAFDAAHRKLRVRTRTGYYSETASVSQ